MKRFVYLLLMSPALVFASSNSQFNFLSISDIHLNTKQTHTMQIDPKGYSSKNDMDQGSFDKLMTAIKNTTLTMENKPYFIIYLGDMVGHSSFVFNRPEYVKKNETTIFKKLLHDYPNTPIINVFGNNDSAQTNYGDFEYENISPFIIAENSGFKNGFLSTGEICSSNTNEKFPCLLKQVKNQGYFSILLKNNLMMIGLNSVMFSPNHNAKTIDIQKQFEFLKSELQLAHNQQMKVLIAMHIPAGDNIYDGSKFWEVSWSNTFLEIISKYQQEIQGILAGHTHMEEFKIIKFSDGSDLGQYNTAGLSTSHGNSPSFKVFSMLDEKNGWGINNYTAYQIHSDEKLFKKYYNFSDEYCQNIDFKGNINNCLNLISFDNTLPQYTVNNPNYSDYPPKVPSAFTINVKS